jgi:hypothetical protein
LARTRARSRAGLPRTSTTASCARPLRASSAATAAVSLRNTASPISPTAHTRRPATTRNGMASCSPIPPGRGGRKKQNPVRKIRTQCPENADIRKGSNECSVCPENADIGEALRCTEKPDISRLPYPSEEEGELIQGSSIVRAPVKAGDVGSTPTPVASSLQVSPELERLIKSKSIRGNGGGRLTAGSSTWHSALRWRQW